MKLESRGGRSFGQLVVNQCSSVRTIVLFSCWSVLDLSLRKVEICFFERMHGSDCTRGVASWGERIKN